MRRVSQRTTTAASQWCSSGAVLSTPARQNLFKYKFNSAVKISLSTTRGHACPSTCLPPSRYLPRSESASPWIPPPPPQLLSPKLTPSLHSEWKVRSTTSLSVLTSSPPPSSGRALCLVRIVSARYNADPKNDQNPHVIMCRWGARPTVHVPGDILTYFFGGARGGGGIKSH